MKKILEAILILTVVPAFSSCSYLEPEALSMITRENVFENIEMHEKMITAIYSYLPNGYGHGACMGWNTSMTDESEAVKPDDPSQNFNLGNWDQYFNSDSYWANCYDAIRACCDFLDGVHDVTWEDYKYSDSLEYNRRVDLDRQFCGESHFLRAFFYFELVKRYGGVPLIKRKLNLKNSEDAEYVSHISRDNFEDCIEFIVAECDLAAEVLPMKWDNSRFGRATAASAKALKSRTLLYAASDLFNQADNTDSIVGYVKVSESDRQARWVRAAEAAKSVLDIPGYGLHPDYRELFVLGSKVSDEVLFGRLYAPSLYFTLDHYPISYNMGRTTTCPSLNLVDSYEMTDGSDFKWGKDIYENNDLYADRDPRLKMTVLVNNDLWSGRNIQSFAGGRDGVPVYLASRTGFYLKKWVANNLYSMTGMKVARQWIFFRLGEIYLNYAEAMLEAYRDPDAIDAAKGLTLSAFDAVQAVRQRKGVNMPKWSFSGERSTYLQFRDKLRNERRVELAFEGHRWFDVRRWMLVEPFNEPLMGLYVERIKDGEGEEVPELDKDGNPKFDENGNPVYTIKYNYIYTSIRQEVEERRFDKKMFLYPIPQSEINKSGFRLKQNPEW